jgi:hypothetical protein
MPRQVLSHCGRSANRLPNLVLSPEPVIRLNSSEQVYSEFSEGLSTLAGLSAANTAAGAADGFWTAKMRRQKLAMVNETERSVSKGRAAAAKKRTASKHRNRSSP